MKPNLKLTIALLAGIALGLAAAHTIHAQQPPLCDPQRQVPAS